MAESDKSLEEFAEEHEEARFAENKALARKVNAVKANLTVVTQDRNRLQTELAVLNRVFEESQVLTPSPSWLRPRVKKEEPHRATLVAMLSDIHAGERVEADEMQGYNAYNLDICDYRLQRFFTGVVKLARDYIAGVKIDGVVLVIGGDAVSGDIHDELVQTNELSTLETVLWLAPKLVTGIEKLAEEFKSVHVISVPGNHGRDSRKPRYKKRSAHNADTTAAKMAAFYFGSNNNAAPGVTFSIPDAFDANFKVYDSRFSTEHGDNMRFSGVSEIGAIGPVKRGTLRKSRQRQGEGDPMDYLLLGHFHQYVPAHNQGFIMNGSIVGYNEYARGWHFTPEEPQQALLVVTPEYGITQNLAVKVGKREKEGW